MIPGSGGCPGKRNGYLFQCSCLEKSIDREFWWATVHGIAKSWTWLSTNIFLICLLFLRFLLWKDGEFYQYFFIFLLWLLSFPSFHYFLPSNFGLFALLLLLPLDVKLNSLLDIFLISRVGMHDYELPSC